MHLSRPLALVLSAALVTPVVALLPATGAFAAPLSAGNIVVTRVGDGSAALTSAATPVFLDEYAPDGTLVQSVPLPTATSGAQKPLTLSGSASSEGALSRSADGRYLTVGGYGATPGTASVGGTTAAGVPRVAARIDGAGAVDTSTALTDAYSGNNIRGVTSDDGSRFWTAGTASGTGGGTRFATLGASSSTLLSTAPTNVRVPFIADGQLYVTSGSNPYVGVNTVGNGLPTAAGQTTALLPGTTSGSVASPYAVVLLDRVAAVPGVDTAYVADDASPTATIPGGLVKLSYDGTSWSRTGTYTGSGALRGLTGSVQGSTARLWAVTAANTLVSLTDGAAAAAAPDVTAGSPVAAGSNRAFRGVAFAPVAPASPAPSITGQPQSQTVNEGQTATLEVSATGADLTYQWYVGSSGDTSRPVSGATGPSYTTPALSATTSYWVRVANPSGSVDSSTATVTVQPVAPGNTAPTVTPAQVSLLALTVDDPTGPPAVRTVTVGDAETPDSLTVSVTTSDATVATGSASGDGAVRTLGVEPVGVGRATLTITVSDGTDSTASTFPVSVSAALPAGTRNHYGASDASTAVDLGNGAMVVADDETNVLRVYDRTASRYPASSFDVRAQGLALRDTDATREIDIEASARSGDTIYWVGSQGQNSSAKTRLNRQELFSTTVNGTGTTATLALGGSYQHLRDDLVAWDNGRGAPLGLADAATRAPEGDGAGGATGVNLEGAEFSVDGNTLYLGFRGPLTSDGKAIVVRLTNPAALVTANPSAGPATFGAPLLWDLGGRGVREIRKNADGAYLILAGPTGAGTGAAGEFRLYSWNGDPATAPLLRSASLDSLAQLGKPEAIVAVPSPLTDSSAVQLLTDSGDTVWYGDGQIAKDLPLAERKAVSRSVAVGTLPACSATPVRIGSVQGPGAASPVAGTTVTVRGTVVGDFEGPSPALRGFYVQDAGDGDAATSDAVFVFTNGADLAALGDVVQVTGTVSEFQDQTQLGGTVSIDRCGTADATPVDVTLPSGDADLESYEGMLVRLPQTLTVTEHFQLGRFGQVVVSSGGRLYQPTQVIPATNTAAVAARQAANDRNQLIVDDASQAQNPDPIVFGRGGQPLSASNTLRGGDTLTGAVGVLSYTWAGNAASPNAFRLRPIGALGGRAVFDPTNPRPTAPPEVGTGGVKVAGANLLNFFNTFSGCTLGVGGATTDCRGPDNSTEYQRQLDKEVAALRFLDADVIGYMEMENDGYGSTSAVRALVDALNDASAPGTWAFVDPDASTGTTNAAGTDAIKAGIIYRTAAVTPVGGAVVDDVDQFERHPVGQTFDTASGARLTVVANHFKSKGSCPTSGPDADQGDGQSCWNARRTAQATELARWIRQDVVPAAGDPDVLLVGDLNSYAKEDPIRVLEDAGYVNQVPRFDGPGSYSYVFDGQWGSLDHAMASASLTSQVTGAGDAHSNADEPSVLDYNTDFKTAGQISSLYAPDRFRTSDHDPVLVGFDLATPPTVTGDPTDGTVGAAYSYTFTVSGSATTDVSDGDLPPGLSLSSDGVLSGTPTAGGDFSFTVRASNAQGSSTRRVTLHVDRAASSTTLTSQPDAPRAGGQVTLTATVGGPVPATGTVEFLDGTASLGSAPVGADGTATLTTSALSAGSHALTARYSGDTSLQGSTSAVRTVQVGRGASKVVVTGLGAPAQLGAPVTFTANVTGPTPATGTVQFSVDGRNVGPKVALVDGSASYRTSTLKAGRHAVRAAYSGDGSLAAGAGSTSQVVQYVVRVLAPAAGSSVKAGSPVQIRLALTDVAGNRIPDSEAASLVGSDCRVLLSANGAQTLGGRCPTYRAADDTFLTTWKTGPRTGAVTLTVSVGYPGVALPQTVRVRFTLT